MAKKAFTNLKDLERYLQNEIHKSLNENEHIIEDVAKQVMQHVTRKIVYNAYIPEKYERRGKDSYGLLDTRNMFFTYHGKTKNGTVSYFENTAYGNDTLEEFFLADTIEHGIKQNWNNPDGEWSKPRPFIQKTAQALNDPEIYPFAVDALKKMFKKSGLNVR